ncbi:MAG: 4-(cytidine 5'-diphospho)-2-C-methyl-D-erythritol kinase [Bacteroidota bacterium]
MILFPFSKINLGLRVLRKRKDGFHDLDTCFYPFALRDILEAIPAEQGSGTFTFSGIAIEGEPGNNLIVKAVRLLQNDFNFPDLSMHLHKIIPMGAGLGGGSSDAVFALKLVNALYHLNLSKEMLFNYAVKLGSDCAFFLENQACLASGRGDILQPITITLKDWYLVLVKPDIHVSTKDAYHGIQPQEPAIKLQDALLQPVTTWESLLFNDFEETVFLKHPEIRHIKEELYRQGAVFALMSGSGASVFGLFREKPSLKEHFRGAFVFEDLLTL